jgi:SAM-dependent methyltransferase
VVASEGPATGHFLQPKWGEGSWGAGTLRDRFDAVEPFIRGPRVLDVGCASRYGKPDWMHGLLIDKFPDAVGIDINKPVLQEIQSRGLDARYADAQDFDLGEKFDTVFGGEVIEHLDNVHGFLTSVLKHVAPNGRLVLTTPNVFYLGGFVYRWGGHGQVHPEHTCWYCEDTLRQVLERNGFCSVEIAFSGHTSPTPARKAASRAAQAILPPRLALDTIVAVASMP